MISSLRFICILFVLVLTACSNAAVKIPEKFLGDWIITVEEKAGFPWWHQIKYPVNLSVSESGLRFTDQGGFECIPETQFYDDEIDMLVFKHCLPNKSQRVYDVFYRAKHKDGFIVGELWTYKLLFKWVGNQRLDRH